MNSYYHLGFHFTPPPPIKLFFKLFGFAQVEFAKSSSLFDYIFFSYSCFLWYIDINFNFVYSSIGDYRIGAPDPDFVSFTIIFVFSFLPVYVFNNFYAFSSFPAHHIVLSLGLKY